MDTNKYRNLYERTHLLFLSGREHEVETIIVEALAQDPENGEAVLCWARLRCAQGREQEAGQRVTELLASAPRDPYYRLAHAIATWTIRTRSQSDSEKDRIDELRLLLEEARSCAGASWDALAKVAFTYIMAGFWTAGVKAFIEAGLMKADQESQEVSPFLTDRRQTNEWLEEAREMDGMGKILNEVRLGVVAKVGVLLVAVNEVGIPEALLAFTRLASRHRKLAKAETEADGTLFEMLTAHSVSEPGDSRLIATGGNARSH